MVLKLDDYKNHQDLLEKIRYINRICYESVAKNILYLEMRNKQVSVIYTVALRDAYSHLAKIFEYEDILEEENKARIVRQLERYLGHLEELLYDTYLKIIKIKSNELFARLSRGERTKIKNQLAEQVQKVRIVDDHTPIEQKKEGFEKIIDFIEDAFTTHHS